MSNMIDLIVKGLIIFAAVISVAYAFARIVQATNSFTTGILSISILIDFYLIILWLLGIDRPVATITFQRIGTHVTITALTLFIPIKLLFTIYIFMKSRQLQEILE